MSLLSMLNREERRQARLFRMGKAREDLIAQLIDETRLWKEIDRGISLSEDPVALSAGYAGLELAPSTVNLATITGSATEQAMAAVTNFAIPVTPQAPKLYRMFMSGTSTTAATPGTYTLAARIGNANTSPILGAVSGAVTPVASATAAQWRCFGVIFLRNVANAASNVVGTFEFNHSGTVGGGGPVSATGNAIFGGLNASGIDFTVATNGVWIGVTHATSTTNTWVPQLSVWGSWS